MRGTAVLSALTAVSLLMLAACKGRELTEPAKASGPMPVRVYLVHLIPDSEPLVVEADRSDTATVVRVKLELPAGTRYEAYRVEIRGSRTDTMTVPPPTGDQELEVSLKLLQWGPGLYRVTVTGIAGGSESKPLAQYRFRLL